MKHPITDQKKTKGARGLLAEGRTPMRRISYVRITLNGHVYI